MLNGVAMTDRIYGFILYLWFCVTMLLKLRTVRVKTRSEPEPIRKFGSVRFLVSFRFGSSSVRVNPVFFKKHEKWNISPSNDQKKTIYSLLESSYKELSNGGKIIFITSLDL